MQKRRSLIAGFAIAGAIGGFALAGPAIVSADAPLGALANITPGLVRVLHTGGVQPNAQYADLGRLMLPVGSFVVTASTTLVSKAATTGVECFLKGPGGTLSHVERSLSAGKGANVSGLLTSLVLNAPSGGNVDLLCRVTNPAADRKVSAQDTKIVAINVPGVTVTNNAAPPASAAV